jgi:hypothetical protein
MDIRQKLDDYLNDVNDDGDFDNDIDLMERMYDFICFKTSDKIIHSFHKVYIVIKISIIIYVI